ncbi:MAG TPA: hypothetical protein VFZ85_16070 [Jiangellaceae bacterium]
MALVADAFGLARDIHEAELPRRPDLRVARSGRRGTRSTSRG